MKNYEDKFKDEIGNHLCKISISEDVITNLLTYYELAKLAFKDQKEKFLRKLNRFIKKILVMYSDLPLPFMLIDGQKLDAVKICKLLIEV